MADAAGIEPANKGFKVPRLASWLHVNIERIITKNHRSTHLRIYYYITQKFTCQFLQEYQSNLDVFLHSMQDRIDSIWLR